MVSKLDEVTKQAVKVLQGGGTIIYPTETVYGLGGNALDWAVIEKIFKIKGREKGKPLIVLVKDFSMAERLCEISRFEGVLKRYWPGALTGIFEARKGLPDGVLKNGKIAIRVSPHPFVGKLFKLIEFPLISTSANRSGGKDCLNIAQVKKSLADRYKLVDFIIDGGELPPSLTSTLIDFTAVPPRVLRQGVVTFSSGFGLLR